MASIVPLFRKYPTVACSRRSNNQTNDRAKGFKHLCVFEPYVIQPQGWDMNIINQYDSYITFNKKFCESRNILSKSYIMNGCFGGHIDSGLNIFRSYNEKIKGVCILGTCGHIGRNREGNIYFLRQELTRKLLVEPFLVKHVYAHKRWGDPYYQGQCPGSPWDVSAVEKVGEYLFCVCFENTYHPLWSWGYLTERLFRCFKAKTIAIYIGCYNIEDYVPKDLFIDFRDFYRDYNRLAEYLIKFPKERYIEMTERAYEWDKTRKVGLLEDFENILKTVVEKEK